MRSCAKSDSDWPAAAKHVDMTLTSEEIFAGLGLTVALAVGSQIVARWLRLPALVVLLPVGFLAGALTESVNPNNLLGPLFQPLVSLAVAIILFESGLGLDLKGLEGHPQRVVRRLVMLGIPITWAFASSFAVLFLGLSQKGAYMLGAILVVSGPTVVGPLLASVGLRQRVRTILLWEGSIIDPIGAIFGALVFHAIVASGHHGIAYQVGQFLASLGVGLAGGLVGTLLLWLLLRTMSLTEIIGTEAALGTVVAVAAVCDILRDDTGLIAAIVIGLALANVRAFNLPARRPFFETVIQLVIGLLFISISASVAPGSARRLLLPTLALVGVLVLVCRPLLAFLATLRTDVSRPERAFIAWMAPRGIVAAATASAFSPALVQAGVPGAADILPVTFLVIAATVTIYALTAPPVARRLGVTLPSRSRPFIVGGREWVVDLARILQGAGVTVVMWAELPQERERIQRAGLELAPGDMIAAATGRGAQFEGVTTVLLMTAQDDFNALAAVTLREGFDGEIYRIAPSGRDLGVVAPFADDDILFGAPLTGAEISRRHRLGAQIVARPASASEPDDGEPLFVVRADGRLLAVSGAGRPTPEAGDTVVLLGRLREVEDAK